MPAKLESLGLRSADGPLRTAVAKAIILPLWGLRGITSLSLMASGGANLGEGCRDFDVGKIAESARFEEEEDLSLKTSVCLTERSEL